MPVRFFLQCIFIGLYFSLPAAELVHHHQRRSFCQPNQSACWPTLDEIQAFQASLSSGSRVLVWPGTGFPRVSAVPTGSPGDQPLYGLGALPGGLSALYEPTAADANHTCFEPSSAPYASTFCLATTRNNEQIGWQPSFTVFALSAADVQSAVKFSVQHDLCISVAGSGHDFLNRHSCPNGMLIRTTLLRDISWPGASTSDYSSVSFGAGIIFDEAQFAVSQKGRVVVSGWSSTVGIAGWSIGGGHGPFNPGFGLGVDNLLSVDMVLASGTLVTANATSNSDLFRAIRGGGGSTWGVIVSFTVKTHPIPPGGFTTVTFEGTLPLCGVENVSVVADFLGAYSRWMLSLDSRAGGLLFSAPTSINGSDCPAQLNLILSYVFHGSSNDSNVQWMAGNFSTFFGEQPKIVNFANSYALASNSVTEYIIPVNWLNVPSLNVNGVPSSFVSRAAIENGLFTALHMNHILSCLIAPSECIRWEIYQDLTGNNGSPHDDNFNSIHPAFRTSVLHVIFDIAPQYLHEWSEALTGYEGGAAYFGESQFNWETDSQWKTAYWYNHYDRLIQVKLKYDPHLNFYCRNCVGADLVHVDP